MVKLEELSREEAIELKAKGKMIAEEVPRTETRWYNRWPIVKWVVPSTDTRYDWEVRRLAKEHDANAFYQETVMAELCAGTEFPVMLQFYQR